MPPSDFVSRGQGLVASGQYQEAVKVCRLGLLGRPTEIDGRLILAQALLALRRYDEVLAEMRVALELDTSLAAAHSLKGEALLRKGDVHAAREALLRARSLAPGDPSIAALYAETELAIASGGARLPSVGDADPQTKHYPSHRGAARLDGGDPSSHSYTAPAGPSARRAAMPPPAERTGTVELDPDMSGVELVAEEDDSLGELVDPPTPSEGSQVTGVLDEDDLTEIDEGDVVDERRAGDSRDSTVAGKPRPARPGGPAGAPDLSALFPDDDASSVDLLARLPPGPPGASVQASGPPIPLRAPPTGTYPKPHDAPRARPLGAPASAALTPSPVDDMRMIRAGLGLDPDARLPPPVDAPPPGRPIEPTGIVVSPPTRARDDDSVILDSDRRAVTGRGHERTRKVATDPKGNRLLPLPRRPSWKVALWSALAVVVIGGGVYGGFVIREMRLDRQVAAARREAGTAAVADTWRGWRASRDVLEGVVSAQDNVSNRAALARARAVLAADFGEDLDGARAAVDALGDVANADAEVARGHLALLDGDAARLEAAVTALATLAPGTPDAEYLAGRAALLAERWSDAIAAFDRARAGAARPAYLIGLAQGHAGRRAWAEARAAIDLALTQHPEHPAAVIERARIVAASRGQGADPAASIATLEKLIAESEKPFDEQVQGVSPTQAAWAALALAELQVLRGDPAAARRALERARAAAPADRSFSVGAIDVLRAIGDLAAAQKEAERAVAAWPAAAGVHVAAAEVALAQGDAARALTALEAAGDLSSRPEALALRGQARLARNEVDGAAADLDAALALAPDLEAALIARAELDLSGGNPRAAVTRLEARYKAAGSKELAVTYAAALREVGERDRARAVLGGLTTGGAAAPIAGRAWLETARLERDAGDNRAARAAYAKAIELLPDATGARLEAALLLVETGDAAGARQSLDRLVDEARPESKDAGRVLVEAARVHTLTGDLDGARALLDRAESSPSAPRWLIARERGRVAVRSRTFPVAIEALDRAAGLEPADGETRLLLIDAHLGAGDGTSARRVLEDVQKRFAGKPEAQLAVGRVRLYFEAFDEAREAFLKAKDQLERDRAAPRWVADATYWLALTTYYAGDPRRARPLVVQAIQLDPNVADAYGLLGQIDADRQQWKSAARAYQKVTVLDPANTDAWFYLGEAALQSRQPKLARTALETYLKKAPSGDLAGESRALLKKIR